MVLEVVDGVVGASLGLVGGVDVEEVVASCSGANTLEGAADVVGVVEDPALLSAESAGAAAEPPETAVAAPHSEGGWMVAG